MRYLIGTCTLFFVFSWYCRNFYYYFLLKLSWELDDIRLGTLDMLVCQKIIYCIKELFDDREEELCDPKDQNVMLFPKMKETLAI